MSPGGRVFQGSRAQNTAILSAITGAERIYANLLPQAMETAPQ